MAGKQEGIVYSPTELTIRELRQSRMAFDIAKDGTVTLTATAFSPRVAADLANTYVDVLLSEVARSRGSRLAARASCWRTLYPGYRRARPTPGRLREVQAQTGGAVKLPDEARSRPAAADSNWRSLADVQVSREIAENRLRTI